MESFPSVVMCRKVSLIVSALTFVSALPLQSSNSTLSSPTDTWQLASHGFWGGREGVMGASFGDFIYLAGGRGTLGLGFYNDVWRSTNGSSWEVVTKRAAWAQRAYHYIQSHEGKLYLFGGQNFFEFFNDVWVMADDGIAWNRLVKNAPWHPRAGLAGASFQNKLVVSAGSWQPNPVGARSFFSDVWVSDDGASWELVTNATGFIPCSGPRLAVLNDRLLLVGGEDGFSEQTQFNHVWATENLKDWEFVVNAAFSNRSGHGVVVFENILYTVAGYLDLHDMWASTDGANWTQVRFLIKNEDLF